MGAAGVPARASPACAPPRVSVDALARRAAAPAAPVPAAVEVDGAGAKSTDASRPLFSSTRTPGVEDGGQTRGETVNGVPHVKETEGKDCEEYGLRAAD